MERGDDADMMAGGCHFGGEAGMGAADAAVHLGGKGLMIEGDPHGAAPFAGQKSSLS